MTRANTARYIAHDVLPEPWKSETRTTLERQAERLLDAGLPTGEVHDVIDSIVSAVRGEYGQ